MPSCKRVHIKIFTSQRCGLFQSPVALSAGIADFIVLPFLIFYSTTNDAALFYMGLLLGRGGITVVVMDAILNYLVDENNFFGVMVQNWLVVALFIVLIWLLAGYLTPRT
jgi:hypothetical protein